MECFLFFFNFYLSYFYSFLIFYQSDVKKPCLSDANGDKIGDIVQANSNEGTLVSGGVPSYQVNNHQQILDNADDYSVPASPVKSEVCVSTVQTFDEALDLSKMII